MAAAFRFIALTAVLLAPLGVAGQHSDADGFFDKADAFLAEAVTQDGFVRYDRAEAAGLSELEEVMASLDLAAMDAEERKALLINAYNIYVVRAVLSAGTPASPLDDDGFFSREAYRLGGEVLSLDQIEKQRLYGESEDARLHFALVCAAESCPPLLPEAYRPEALEAQLEAQTRRALGLPHIARMDGGSLVLSRIFDWYRGDFERASPDGTLAGYVRQYRSDVPASATVRFADYDWTLNAAR